MRELWRRLKYLVHRNERAEELDEEMRTHLAMRSARLREQGVDPNQAEIAARRRFGNRASLELAGDAAWGWTAVDRLVQDVRQALRALRKTPGFAAIAVLTLAVGLGMNTAIFSIVNAVMLRSLPYPDPERLVSLWEQKTKREQPQRLNTTGTSLSGTVVPERMAVAPANLMDYRAGTTTFEGLAGVDGSAMNLTGAVTPDRVQGEAVTANYFAVLGVKPAIGRGLRDEDDREGAEKVVVLSHEFWQGRLGGDTAVLSHPLEFDGRPYTVVGVMPPGFQPATQFSIRERVEFWVPAAYPKELLANHGDHEIGVVGRLRPGITVAAAQDQLRSVSEGLSQQYPDSNKGLTAVIAPMRDDIVRNVRDSLKALWGASGLIVLITCLNVANLLLVRAVGRRHETSVRMALGAGRMRIARQFLVESLLVAAVGCAAGLVLGRVLMRVLVVAAPPNIPRLDGVAMDWRVFLAAAVATVTGLAFGLGPAWNASRTSPGESLKSSERKSAGQAQTRWRAVLTVAEVALSIVLIVGAGLFLKSFATIMGMDLGFRTENVLAMSIPLPGQRYPTAENRLRFFEDLEGRVRALPGVEQVAFANRFPLRGGWGSGIEVEGAGNTRIDADSQAISTSYFATLGIPLFRGRVLAAGDRLGQPHVAVVNQAFERKFLNGSSAIGRRFRRGPKAPWITVAGIVNDVRRGGKTQEMSPQIYLPAAQTDIYPVWISDLAVRTASDPRLSVKAIQQQVWSIDKDQPVTNVRTMQEIIDRSVSERRFQMLLLMVFAGVAAVLAVIGISGVLTYSVNQRMNEIGVRIALGASPGRIVSMVLRQAGLMIAAGVVLGIGGALALTRLVANLLFHVQTNDATTYIGAIGVLVLAALGAALVPALRGSRVDPLVALRYE